MNAEKMDEILEGYFKISLAAQKALRDHPECIAEPDRWLPKPYAGDFNTLDMSVDGTYVSGSASVFTNQTGGSNEWMEFQIPTDILNKYLED